MHIHNIMILIFITCADHQSHSCRADKNPYRHDGRADKDTYRHDGRAYSLSRWTKGRKSSLVKVYFKSLLDTYLGVQYHIHKCTHKYKNTSSHFIKNYKRLLQLTNPKIYTM